MNRLTPLPPELADLLEEFCLGELTPQAAERLEQLITADREYMRHYIRFTSMHALAERFEGADFVRESQLLEQVVEAAAAAREAASGDVEKPSPVRKEQGQSDGPRSTMSGLISKRDRWPRMRDLTGWTFAVLSTISVVLAIAVVLLVNGLHSKSGFGEIAQLHLPDRAIPSVTPAAKPDEAARGVARLGRLSGVRWAKNQLKLTGSDRLTPGQDIKLDAGRAEISFDVGAQMVIEGPAHVRILGPLQAQAFLGKITARVGKNAHGFSIVTPRGKVVDLGTNFGLGIDRSGREEIAVFEGQVDIDYSPAEKRPIEATPAPSLAKRRLTAGEAVCVNSRGELGRLPAITSETFPHSVHPQPNRSPVIGAVADNIRLPESAQYYEVVHGGLDDGAQSYVDRPCRWRSLSSDGLPDALLGADYVKTFNNDKLRKDYQLTLQLDCPADLFVFTDDRVMVPDWVREKFRLTSWKIGMEQGPFAPRDFSTLSMGEGKSISCKFSVWRLSVPTAGTVKLGRLPTYPTGETRGLGLNWTAANMYGIAAVARHEGGPLAVVSNEAGASSSAGTATILASRSVDSIVKELGAVPRPEHPRPDKYRKDWHNLNGVWEFAFDRDNVGQSEKWQDKPNLSGQRIVVPFPPESVLSGIHDEGIHPRCWYARSFDVPDVLRGRRLLLHFGAVDYRAELWLNGRRVGSHEGGYDPFDFDVTEIVKPSGNRLVVRVEDDPTEKKPRGKQSPDLRPRGAIYSRVSGIWQTVWLEAVGASFVRDWTIRADVDTGAVSVDVRVDGPAVGLRVEAKASPGIVRTGSGESAAEGTGAVANDRSAALVLRVPHPALWTPSTPNLYDLELRLIDAKGQEIDRVKTYFGFRKIEVRNGQYLLNGEPFFLISALDQGYNPTGLYTPPSDDYQREDVLWAKRYGLNSIRKHQIVPEPRFFYWCDRLGLTVWAEMADWGADLHDCDGFLREWRPRVQRDINHPSIITWVPLNEKRGRDPQVRGNMVKIYDETRRLDATRPVLDNSGWGHTKTDITDLHTNAPDFHAWWENWRHSIAQNGNYLIEPGLPAFNPGFWHQGQPVVISEVGLWRIDGYPPLGPWEEYGSTKVPNEEAYLDLYCDVIVGLMSEPDCAGFSYVQLYDVEGEVNGYLTYDRRPKVPPEVIRTIHAYGLGRHWANRPGQQLEAGLANTNASVAKVQTLVPSSKDSAQVWRFTTEDPGNDWTADTFDDSRWKSGPGGFGTEGTPGAVVRTVWDNSDIWLRKSFEVSEIPAGGKLFLELHHDEDAEIYINGKQVKSLEGFVTRYLQLPLDAAAVRALRQGRNTIAVHCHNTAGGQYVDVGLLMYRPSGSIGGMDAGAETPPASARQGKDASENTKSRTTVSTN
jgi:hypothetical protein